MNLRPLSWYARELGPALPAGAFAPARSRLAWLPVHLTVIAVCSAAIARGWVGWPLALLLSLVIGCSFAGLTFLGHETLHGAVVKNRALQLVVGWIGFLPFVVSPRLWRAWHNRVHHGHANQPGADPDAYQTLSAFEAQGGDLVVENFSPGRRRWLGLLGFVIGYTGQSAHMLMVARARGYLSPAQHRRAILETSLGILFWAAVAVAVGPVAFLAIFLLPHLVANAIVMVHIFTNHSLSPHTEVNDPLVNSLTVTLPRVLEWLTLGFGYHTEHHIFPSMSTRQGPMLRELIRARWPERYQSMPLVKALALLHRTPRLYQSSTVLVDPATGEEWQTLQPGAGAAAAGGRTEGRAGATGREATAQLADVVDEVLQAGLGDRATALTR